MDQVLRISNSNRYVIDDDIIPKVTSDGEPHEMMTLIAGLCGLLAAVIVLSVLVMLIGCNDSERIQSVNPPNEISLNRPVEFRKPFSIIPMFTKRKNDNNHLPQLTSISIIANNASFRMINTDDYSNATTTKPFKLTDITTGRF